MKAEETERRRAWKISRATTSGPTASACAVADSADSDPGSRCARLPIEPSAQNGLRAPSQLIVDDHGLEHSRDDSSVP